MANNIRCFDSDLFLEDINEKLKKRLERLEKELERSRACTSTIGRTIRRWTSTGMRTTITSRRFSIK